MQRLRNLINHQALASKSSTNFIIEYNSNPCTLSLRFNESSHYSSRIICFSKRNNHRRCSMKKGVLRNFNRPAATLLKKRLWHRCFPVNFARFLRTPFLQKTSGRQLLFKSSKFNLTYNVNNIFGTTAAA